MPNYGDPRYTETFLQFQENNPNALEDIIVMSTTDRSNALINMLKAILQLTARLSQAL